ncbi:hypothetical protein EVAR_67042_1 [Eumeta japonica]|uniref:Uncharacterized protein n=1 Tax=Eumeta variegata TaxID=151549 RepID=A0A4C1ZTZ9_EUMVA|nr:hypothetical protein EVAR_67042_1 [Eumeta japonica]
MKFFANKYSRGVTLFTNHPRVTATRNSRGVTNALPAWEGLGYLRNGDRVHGRGKEGVGEGQYSEANSPVTEAVYLPGLQAVCAFPRRPPPAALLLPVSPSYPSPRYGHERMTIDPTRYDVSMSL